MITTIVEAGQEGALLLPAELLGRIPAAKRYIVTIEDDVIVVRPMRAAEAFWQTATAAERIADLRRWAAGHRDSPGLPADALRRERLYD